MRRTTAWGMHKSNSGSITPPLAASANDINLRPIRSINNTSSSRRAPTGFATSASGRMSPSSAAYPRPGSASGSNPAGTWGSNGATPGRPQLGSRRDSAASGSIIKGKGRDKYGEGEEDADEVDLLRGGGERDGAFDDGWKDPEEEESTGLLGGKSKGKSREPSLARGDRKAADRKGKGRGKARTMVFSAPGTSSYYLISTTGSS